MPVELHLCNYLHQDKILKESFSITQVYSGLYSRVGHMNLISDGFAWTLFRCIHGDKKFNSAQRFVALKAECNLKLAVALTIMEECFLPMIDARTGIDMIPHVLYNWGSVLPLILNPTPPKQHTHIV